MVNWEKLELKVNIFDRFPFLVQETLDDWPYRKMSHIFQKCAGKIETAYDNDDIKLQMIYDLWGDYQKNKTYKNYKNYPTILLEILMMKIKN